MTTQWMILLWLAGMLVAVTSLHGQNRTPPALNDILVQLEKDSTFYKSQIPEFFCREHVVSQFTSRHDPPLQQVTVTDSTFMLKRRVLDDQSTLLDESREVLTVNGSPTRRTNLGGPAILIGVFARGLDVVSLLEKSCMRYSVAPLPQDKSREFYIIQFETTPDAPTHSDCVLDERAAGKVLIDKDKMQVVRMELTAPHHAITAGLFGKWTIVVNYVPIQLGEHTFWLPKTVKSALTPEDDEDTIWSFNASYNDYHKFEVSSKILPPGRTTTP